jgi:hypothetical protein
MKLKNNILIQDKLDYSYFIVHSGKQDGLYFNELTDSLKYVWLKKDSVLLIKNIRDNKFQDLLIYDSLIYRKLTKDSILTEKYIPKSVYKGNFVDSTYFTYSNKIKDIPFSLSSYLDSFHSSKLAKVKLIFNSRVHPESKSIIPKQVWTYELFPINRDEYYEVREKLMNKAKELFDNYNFNN